jgi:nitrogen regulatory protein PII
MLMALLVLNDPDKLRDVLEAWEAIGVSGITILHSTGPGKLRQDPSLWEDIPLLPSIEDFYEREELFSRTLISVVPSEEIVEKLASTTRRLIGDFNKPDTGIFVVLPVMKVYGLEKETRIFSEDFHDSQSKENE